MTSFHCIPIDTDIAARFRRTGIDDGGNPIRSVRVDDPRSYPCRHCLDYGQVGAVMLLGSYALPRPRGIYGGASPIFVHAEGCRRFDRAEGLAPILRETSLASVRSYNSEDQCLYDLGRVVPGADIDDPLRIAMADPRTAYVNVHSARPGCLLCRVERPVSPSTT